MCPCCPSGKPGREYAVRFSDDSPNEETHDRFRSSARERLGRAALALPTVVIALGMTVSGLPVPRPSAAPEPTGAPTAVDHRPLRFPDSRTPDRDGSGRRPLRAAPGDAPRSHRVRCGVRARGVPGRRGDAHRGTRPDGRRGGDDDAVRRVPGERAVPGRAPAYGHRQRPGLRLPRGYRARPGDRRGAARTPVAGSGVPPASAAAPLPLVLGPPLPPENHGAPPGGLGPPRAGAPPGSTPAVAYGLEKGAVRRRGARPRRRLRGRRRPDPDRPGHRVR